MSTNAYFQVTFKTRDIPSEKTPVWATRAARKVSRGAVLSMYLTAGGSWKVHTVYIVRGHGKNVSDAKRLASRIVRVVENKQTL